MLPDSRVCVSCCAVVGWIQQQSPRVRGCDCGSCSSRHRHCSRRRLQCGNATPVHCTACHSTSQDGPRSTTAATQIAMVVSHTSHHAHDAALGLATAATPSQQGYNTTGDWCATQPPLNRHHQLCTTQPRTDDGQDLSPSRALPQQRTAPSRVHARFRCDAVQNFVMQQGGPNNAAGVNLTPCAPLLHNTQCMQGM